MTNDTDDTPPTGGTPPLYGCVHEWVDSWLRYVYQRRIHTGDHYWDATWFAFPEAMLRLTVLWQSWEAARTDPWRMSTWMRDHLDHHMGVLLSSEGPFRDSTTAPGNQTNAVTEPLPCATPPRCACVPHTAHPELEECPYALPDDAEGLEPDDDPYEFPRWTVTG